MIAHQRVIREKEAARDPRATATLEGCRVIPVTRAWALPIILKYEWLGTLGASMHLYGLVNREKTPLGVIAFGMPNGTNSRNVCGAKERKSVIALERGACVHFAHEHSASFLISRAVNMCHKKYGYDVFIAYSDIQAGEIGTVYQACNWLYLGRGNGRSSNYRWKARELVNGVWGDWKSSRQLRAMGYNGKQDWNWLRASPNWEFQKDIAKARYVTFRGSKTRRRELTRKLRYDVQPYPKRI